MSSESTLSETFIGALQGTISVLLTCFAGYVVARRGFLNQPTVKHISKLCTSIFLPSLLIVQMGPELTTGSLSKYWIIPLWGLLSATIAHLIGWAGQYLFRLKHWTIVACGRPNSNALPLLLLQSLETTGMLEQLSGDGESVKDTLGRAKSLLLLNAIVQDIITIQLAPAVLGADRSRREKDKSPDRLKPGPGKLSVVQDEERAGLLDDVDSEGSQRDSDREMGGALGPIADVPDLRTPQSLRPLEKPIKTMWSYMSAPLIGAIIAFILGILPPLHEAFLSKHGVMYIPITQAVKNLGDLFVVLQTFAVGAELGLVPSSHPGYRATIWVLMIRFLVMPAIGMLFVWTTAGRGWYVSDPLVWFLLVLLPAGPSAMLLVNVAEIVDIDQGPIVGYMTVAYLLAPLMAVVCAIGLGIVKMRSG
ncbi:uncharacterized protein LAESUDRAFT_342656 [Laetiporus sulphureus 93-53]|uniref:Auxin efflux carrier n=1 Tax=Laetiporus sulphureus 93-53 TaxID=1314785 RepID=A0A165GPZ4_9APHY|nr:uncharacterized protein LAESUDRAFT_342656 [Laetiporus sulphureus 93-53]KZT10648.1 hypothetical protein LAESUDRAFT_342656 [Laetiporus sulphureus 93-53]